MIVNQIYRKIHAYKYTDSFFPCVYDEVNYKVERFKLDYSELIIIIIIFEKKL